MRTLAKYHEQLVKDGFALIENVYSDIEIQTLISKINSIDDSEPTFRKTKDLFAIRQFLKEVPKVNSTIFTGKLNSIINELFGSDYFAVKSIYFDKPEESNWFVSYHQDLTISVNRKVHLPDYSSWTIKHNQFAVQPPVSILESNFTIRIHLDDTDENNGALKVIPGSHRKGVQRIETIDCSANNECICKVNAGDIMIMRPLLFHASNRTTHNKRRRVIHIEFSNAKLPNEIEWSEAS